MQGRRLSPEVKQIRYFLLLIKVMKHIYTKDYEGHYFLTFLEVDSLFGFSLFTFKENQKELIHFILLKE